VSVSVIVPMVKIGIVGVPVSQRNMLVPVRMRFAGRHSGRVLMLVMIVMLMPVFGKRCTVTLRRFRRSQGVGCGAQCQGINSSMRFCGQPFTSRVSKSAK
jgi:hypothetical protein